MDAMFAAMDLTTVTATFSAALLIVIGVRMLFTGEKKVGDVLQRVKAAK